MEARDGAAMERYIKFYYKGENSKVKSCLHEGKKEVKEQFVMRMNQNVDENRNLKWVKRICKRGRVAVE